MEDENSNLRNPIVNARNGQFALIFKCIFNQFGVCKWRFLWPGKLKEKRDIRHCLILDEILFRLQFRYDVLRVEFDGY